MESVEGEVIYWLFTTVLKIEQKFLKVWDGQSLVPDESLGWFVQFEGSTESIRLGDEKPPWEPGDRVEIRFRRQL